MDRAIASATPAPGRIVPLEAIRGIAALVVVIYHGLLGFAPQAIHGGDAPLALLRQFAAGLVNGGAAVSVFFVLSGFVLSRPFARGGGLRRSAIAIGKRWPRLAGMTVIACLFAWGAIVVSGHAYRRAARAAHAPWLGSHANSPLAAHAAPTWHGALWEGAIGVFTRGEVHFDSALWTMRIELFCSIAIFLIAPAVFACRWRLVQFGLLGLGVLLAGTAYPATYLADFLCGMGLAVVLDIFGVPRMTGARLALLLGVALFCFGYRGSQDFSLYAPVRAILPPGDTNHYVWDCGALALMLAVLGHAPLYRGLSRRWAAWLGVLSFPVYTIHIPILLSLGAASFLQGDAMLGKQAGALIAVAVTLAASLALAVPFAWLDRHWCAVLGRASGALSRAVPPGRPGVRRPRDPSRSARSG